MPSSTNTVLAVLTLAFLTLAAQAEGVRTGAQDSAAAMVSATAIRGAADGDLPPGRSCLRQTRPGGRGPGPAAAETSHVPQPCPFS